MKKLQAAVGIALVTLILLGWAPWLTKEYAEERAVRYFEEIWEGVIDGCGLNCEGCGIAETNRDLLGYEVGLQFRCGLYVDEQPYDRNRYLVTPIGKIYEKL